MDTALVKIFATALGFSQVAGSEPVRTYFDPVEDQARIVELLRGGCALMRKAFDIEDINLDDVIATAMDDADAIAGENSVVRGIDIKKLPGAYRQFCGNDPVDQETVDIAEVIKFYNQTLAELPDHSRLKGMKLPGVSNVLDVKGTRFADVHEPDHRRVWVSLKEIPLHVQQAFIAAEDKRFYQHRGVDERALIRAFVGNFAQSGRPQGGSTITQQVVKNTLVGEDVTLERKMREMILASRVENSLSKAEILELYLNSIFLGRGSWGIEMAARSYFGKTASTLSLSEAALLAGITKGPTSFSPDRNPVRARQRYDYVLTRMNEDGAISAMEKKEALAKFPRFQEGTDGIRRSYFADQVGRELKQHIAQHAVAAGSYTIRSTLHPDLQHATELALQEGLARFEMDSGRIEFHGPETSLAQSIERLKTERISMPKPLWQLALQETRMPLYDVHWQAAVVIEKLRTKNGASVRVGLADGRTMPLNGKSALVRELKLHDVVLVHVTARQGISPMAEIRVRPTVQGASVVIENKSGRILAMAGGFSYPLSQLNRVTQSQRQPGSALKPLTYLAALQKGLQPNAFVRDQEITLPPLLNKGDSWSPKNYDGGASGSIPMRTALAKSRNLATVNLLNGGIDTNPSASFERICVLALELQIYKQCSQYYPFVLGAQATRPIDLALFYATIANEGTRPTPYAIESIEQEGAALYRHSVESTSISAADAASFYQLKTMLQGVVEQGTASRMKHLAPYVAGKTGTSDDENDVWFVGFTNDVTIAVWVGYDNADGKRRTLGAGHTGGSVAVPIFEQIVQASWADGLRQEPLKGPSPAARQLLAVTTQDRNGDRRMRLVEYLRRDPNSRAPESRHATVRGVSDTAKSRPARQYVRRDPWESGWAPRAYSWGWGGPAWEDRRYNEDHRYHENNWASQSRRRSFEPARSFFWR